MTGYRRGTLSLHALSAAVAAALGRSPHAWVEPLKPVVEQVLKKQQETTEVNSYSARPSESCNRGSKQEGELARHDTNGHENTKC